MQRLGYGTRAKKSAHCPFHEDTTPSFSVWKGVSGWQWKCHGGCGAGDEIDFLRVEQDLGQREAVAAYLRLASGEEPDKVASPRPCVHEPPPQIPFQPPAHLKPNESLVSQVLSGRDYNREALWKAINDGILRFYIWRGALCYGVTDMKGVICEIRRADNHHFMSHKTLSARKTHTISGSCKTWPVGSLEASRGHRILICEGIPDFLTAYHRILKERAWATRPVCMLGASCKMHEGSLVNFDGKIVQIFAHGDKAGRKAAATWAYQLKDIAVKVEVTHLKDGDLFDYRDYDGKLIK